jgi:hypothetical protein
MGHGTLSRGRWTFAIPGLLWGCPAVCYGEVPEEHRISTYTVQVRLDNGSPLNLRMTRPVQDALYGPPILGTPERAQWEAAQPGAARSRTECRARD